MKQRAVKGRRKLAESEKVRQRQLGRRVVHPMVVSLTAKSRHTIVLPKDFAKINVDERYQRVKITTMVNTLVHVLRAGGIIPDPVSLAERSDGSLWILDGQQRFWAHSECEVPMPAVIYPVDDFEQERKLFLVFNDTVRVTPDITVNSWPGPGAELLRKLAESPTHPLCGRVNFGRHHRRPYGASVLMRGLSALLHPDSPRAPTGRIQEVLSRVDTALNKAGARDMVQTYFELMTTVFAPPTRLHLLPAIAFAKVLGRRWDNRGVESLGPRVTNRLRRANWETMVPSWAQKYLPVLVSEVEKRLSDKT